MPTASEIGISGEKVTMRDAMKSRTRSPFCFCVGSFMTPWCPHGRGTGKQGIAMALPRQILAFVLEKYLCSSRLAADGNEGHETWLRQGIAPAMARAVL